MDYLDPKKKKHKRTRLLVGYGLLGVAIAAVTVLFVYIANGYYIDRETGVVIQNGLVYIDSKPESAQITLNGTPQGNPTSARMVIPEGTHEFWLTRDGYLPWKRTIQLDGGTVRRLTYPRLFPVVPTTELALTLRSTPTDTAQSPDKRWLMVAFADDPLQLGVVDVQAQPLTLTPLVVPPTVLATVEPGTWTFLGWADDSRTVLAEYRSAGAVEYVFIDRADPAATVSVSGRFATTPFTAATLRDDKAGQVYLHDAPSGQLYRADTSSGVAELHENGVLQYDTVGNDGLLYTTTVGAEPGMVRVVFRDGDQRLVLRELSNAGAHQLQLDRFSGDYVMGVGAPLDNSAYVYHNPEAVEGSDGTPGIPVPDTILRVDSPVDLSISTDGSAVLTYNSAGQFATHEFSHNRSYEFEQSGVVDVRSVHWVDGAFFVVSSGSGAQQVVDFHGDNAAELGTSDAAFLAVFDRALDHMYTLSPAAAPGEPAQVIRTFLRTVADR